MSFFSEDFTIKLLSVQHLDWKGSNSLVAPRPHDALSFRTKGNSVILGGGKREQLKDCDLLFMPKNLGYTLRSGEESILVVHFDMIGKKRKNFEVFHPAHSETFRNLFYSAYEEWSARKQGYYFKTMSYFYKLLSKMEVEFTKTNAHPSYQKIKNSLDYLHANFTDVAITVPSLCSLSNISDTYFRKLFFDVYGTTPVDYINKLRLSYAYELLQTQYYPVSVVAEKCGFDDVKYFSTVFKKTYQRTPSSVFVKENGMA